MAFVRPGVMDLGIPLAFVGVGEVTIENLIALATGMVVGQVAKVMAVWCLHRRKTVLQVLQDNE